MGGLSPWHLLILLAVMVVLFGAKKLPDAARGIGRSLKILKAETKGLTDEEKAESDAASAEHKELESSTSPSETDKVAELQKQLDELKKQQADRSETNAN